MQVQVLSCASASAAVLASASAAMYKCKCCQVQVQVLASEVGGELLSPSLGPSYTTRLWYVDGETDWKVKYSVYALEWKY